MAMLDLDQTWQLKLYAEEIYGGRADVRLRQSDTGDQQLVIATDDLVRVEAPLAAGPTAALTALWDHLLNLATEGEQERQRVEAGRIAAEVERVRAETETRLKAEESVKQAAFSAGIAKRRALRGALTAAV